MKKLTQTQRVLRALRAKGGDGVTAIDFMPPTIDGGPPIMRLAARIYELREDGFRIASRTGGVVDTYVLEAGDGVPAEFIITEPTPGKSNTMASAALFGADPPPRRSHYDDDLAA